MFIYYNEIENPTHMVQGWHYKVFDKELSITDIMMAWRDDPKFESPMLWPNKSPEGE